ncbi:hypothetical protein AZE42_13603 [Rhizopogon vesiculosus]|uniref:GPI ethanolamine phosphate transferase 1 C-terminal domain-containing protein n=1 Tax=Rhizopogon vesiculosus TaxID=180088 RepID=A0A1J8Q143_9AGAM|nr:hypothetical protein AZE42_13603 [Rhizopogon vesiculosus]
MIMCGGATILAVGAGYLHWVSSGTAAAGKVSVVEASFIVLMTVITTSSVKSIQAKQGLPIINQTLAWIILGMLVN